MKRCCFVLRYVMAVTLLLWVSQASATNVSAPPTFPVQLLPSKPVAVAGAFELILRLSLAAGWHVNAHKPSFEFLIPTNASLIAPRDWRLGEVHYPRPIERAFAFTGGRRLAVYEGDVVLKLRLHAPSGAELKATQAVTVALRFQPCSDRICLPPRTVHRHIQIGLNAAAGETPTARDRSG